MTFEVGTYLICLGKYNDYLPAVIDKVPNTVWVIRTKDSYGTSYANYKIYKLSSVDSGGYIEVSDYWLEKDFRPLNENELIIKDILE